MRFFGNIFAWALATLIAYCLASVFNTQMVLQENIASFGIEIPMAKRVEATLTDLQGLYLYAIIIGVAFAIGFFVASLVKAVLPFLSAIAYPVAGAAALALAFFIMTLTVPGGEIPIISAQTQPGYILQLVAAALGGLVFELLRPKQR